MSFLNFLLTFCPPFWLLVFLTFSTSCFPFSDLNFDWLNHQAPERVEHNFLSEPHLCVCHPAVWRRKLISRDVNLTHRLLPLHLRFTPGTFPCVSSVYFAWGTSAGISREVHQTTHKRQTRRLEGDKVTRRSLDIYFLSKLNDNWSPLTHTCTHDCAHAFILTQLCANEHGYARRVAHIRIHVFCLSCASQRKFTGPVWCSKPWCHTVRHSAHEGQTMSVISTLTAFLWVSEWQPELDSFDTFHCGCKWLSKQWKCNITFLTHV